MTSLYSPARRDCRICAKMAVRMGIIMAVVAVLLIHIERNQHGNMMPSNNLHTDGHRHSKNDISLIRMERNQHGNMMPSNNLHTDGHHHSKNDVSLIHVDKNPVRVHDAEQKPVHKQASSRQDWYFTRLHLQKKKQHRAHEAQQNLHTDRHRHRRIAILLTNVIV